VFLFSYLFSSAQNVEIIVEMEKLSPFIKTITKEEMIARLLDSITWSCNSKFGDFGSGVIFFDRRRKADLIPDYVLTVRVFDTIASNANHGTIYMPLVDAKIYEANLPADSVKNWMNRYGIGYGYDSSMITESRAMEIQFFSLKMAATSIARDFLPVSGKFLQSANVDLNWLSLFEQHQNVIIEIDSSNVGPGRVDHLNMVASFIRNIFLRRQQMYYKATTLKKGYFNYYFAFDSIPQQVVIRNPIKIIFVIEEQEGGYWLRLLSNDKRVALDKAEATAYLPMEMIEARPSWVHGRISSIVRHFVFKNL
jgi:hypothetical protein